MKKIVVLGASGMLGHKVFEVLSKNDTYQVFGTVTKKTSFADTLPAEYEANIIEGVYADNISIVDQVFNELSPNVVINCIGVIKQNESSKDTYNSIVLNALFPHQAAKCCEQIGARFITIATDCVFDGQKGESYQDDDVPTCHDVYGMTKYLGEVNEGNVLTLRTSIIGHELNSHLSLLDWFLSQTTPTVKGYEKAIFSGFTTIELAHLLSETIIQKEDIRGRYHLSVNPISKHDLLAIVAKIYKKNIEIIPDSSLVIDRSLNSDALRAMIGYHPPSWEQLIQAMHQDFRASDFYQAKREQYDQHNHV